MRQSFLALTLFWGSFGGAMSAQSARAEPPGTKAASTQCEYCECPGYAVTAPPAAQTHIAEPTATKAA